MNWYTLEGREVKQVDDVTRCIMNPQDNRVAYDKINDIEISTVFLALDHSFMGGQPVLFETMVFGGSLDGEQERYHTWDEAEAGHKVMIERVKAELEKQ